MMNRLQSKVETTDEDSDPTRWMQAAQLDPDPWQRDLLRGAWDRALLNVCRQGGKSTATAALALDTALSGSDALVLILAPARRQSKELLMKVRTMYRDAGPETRIEKWSELRLRFENGSRIITLPGREATVRGFTADLIIGDEAARIPDELYQAVRPMLAVSGGRLVALSTPRGQRGWFFNAWTDSEQEWERVKIDGYDCPRLSEEFLEQERREMGEYRFAQEYLCRFQDTENQMFRTEDIEAALSGDPGGLFEEDATDFLTDTDPLFTDG
jgi:hypothetical protein